MGDVVLERGRGGPSVSTSVLGRVDDSVDDLDVLARTSEEEESDVAGGGGCWSPGDDIWLASLNLLLKTRLDYGIALGITFWGSEGSGQTGKCGDDGCESETHYGYMEILVQI